MDMNILVILIKLIHYLLILFVLLGTFSSNPKILILHIATTVSLLIHWACNNDTCFLTILECKLLNIEKKESFINSIVSPVYNKVNTDKAVSISVAILLLSSILKINFGQ